MINNEEKNLKLKKKSLVTFNGKIKYSKNPTRNKLALYGIQFFSGNKY